MTAASAPTRPQPPHSVCRCNIPISNMPGTTRNHQKNDISHAQLVRAITAAGGPAKRQRRGWTLILILIAGMICGGWAGYRFISFSESDASAIRTLVAQMTPLLQSGDTAQASRLFVQSPAPTPFGEPAFQAGIIEKMHTDLAAHGLVWTEAKPLAFGGVSGKVAAAGSEEWTRVWGGRLFLGSDGQVFGVDLSAVRGKDGWRFTHIWDWTPIDLAAAGLQEQAGRVASEITRELRSQSSAPVKGIRMVALTF